MDKAIELEVDARVFKKVFRRGLRDLMDASLVRNGTMREGMGYDPRKYNSPSGRLVIVGGMMEKTEELLKMVNEEVTESKKILQKLSNEVRVAAEAVQPQLVDQIKTLRDTRMTMVREIQNILEPLRDIRKFFLDNTHEEEMEKLQKFVTLCQELGKLKQSGVLDAIVDSIIRLGIKEVNHEG